MVQPAAQPCVVHSKKLMGLWRCGTCPRSDAICYRCVSLHCDRGCHVSPRGGATPHDHRSRVFANHSINSGAEYILNVHKLRCPCGAAFLDKSKSSTAAICCGCGGATCSPECHLTHCENTGLCTYNKNLSPEESKRRRGCRCIKVRDMLPAVEMFKAGKESALVQCGGRYFEADIVGHEGGWALLMRRGYLQFGSPCAETLDCLAPTAALEDADSSLNPHRLCTCACDECTSRSLHPWTGHTGGPKDVGDDVSVTKAREVMGTGCPADVQERAQQADKAARHTAASLVQASQACSLCCDG